MDVIKIVLAALLSILTLFVITKIMGHKQVAQFDFFDYVSGITIGSIGAELATELEEPENPLIALLVYGLFSVILNLIAHKIPSSRKYINGTPTILMNEGKLYRKNLKKSKLDLSEFMLMCRERGYFDLEEIQSAIFEHNGKLSVIPKAAYRPATPQDLNITVKAAYIGVEVIMDGRIMGENLFRMGKDKKWIYERLRQLGCNDSKDIFLAVYYDAEDRLKIYKNEDCA